jgi:FkbM family methyltransferase
VVAGVLNILPLGIRLAVLQRVHRARRRIDFADEPIYLEITSEAERLRLQPCAKEPETVEWLLSHAATAFVLYDIGANVGVYSLIAATLGPEVRIIAFEPAHTTFPRLVDNIRANGVGDRVTALQVALGERTDILSFGYARLDPGAADHPGISEVPGGTVARHSVLCYRLDDLVSHFGLPQPTLLKLDVDGAELSVLLGAAETLRNAELRSVLVELREADERSLAVERLLAAAGFNEVASRVHAGGEVRNAIWSRRS